MIPQRFIGSLKRYSEAKIPCGHFLTAILENDLLDTINRADEDAIKIIPELVKYVYNELPMECWGSPEKVKSWLNCQSL